MDILKILEESAEDLIPEDLDFFETELAISEEYDEVFKARCKEKIQQIRKWSNNDTLSSKKTNKKTSVYDNEKAEKKIVLDIDDVVPDSHKNNKDKKSISLLKQVQDDIKELRNRDDYKSAFKNYIKNNHMIDEKFLDKNFTMFEQWEINAIVSVKQLSEEFLEKYFGAINHDTIARYQKFSENFFIKHFSQLDSSIVIKYGKNNWRKKENRSKQLDIFLRLKGVKD